MESSIAYGITPSTWSLSLHLEKEFKKLPEVANRYFNNDIEVPNLPITDSGKKLYKELRQIHQDLRQIEDSSSDFQKSQKIENVKADILNKKQLSSEKDEQLEQDYASAFDLTQEFSIYSKIIEKRQTFLDCIHKIMLYYQTFQIETWDIDTSETIRLLQQVKSLHEKNPFPVPNKELMSAHFEKEIADHQNPFSHLFLQCALDKVFQVKNILEKGENDGQVVEIHFYAIKCLNQFTHLRDRLETDCSESIESVDLLNPLLGFASAFAKVKEMGMRITNLQCDFVLGKLS